MLRVFCNSLFSVGGMYGYFEDDCIILYWPMSSFASELLKFKCFV